MNKNGCGSHPSSCANPVTTSGTPVVQEAIDNNCAQASGFGVVGCLEYVRYETTVIAGASDEKNIFPSAGEVQPIGFLDSRTDVDGYLEEPKVGGTDVLPAYGGDTTGEVTARSYRIVDQNATAWRAGINLLGTIPVVINPNVKLSFNLRNAAAATVTFEFYWLFVRAS